MRSPTHAARLPALTAAAGCLLLSIPYLTGLRGFFASDDWILLYYYGRTPPWDLATFFSPQVVWFYRPLQALQFSLLFHTFGLDPVPYNLTLIAMHFGVCALVFLLARELSGRPAFAAATAILFASQWSYVDVVTWKSNINTLQWAAISLGAALAFTRYLSGGGRGWLYLTWALCAVGGLAKEMTLNLPLLLAVTWGSAGNRTAAPRVRDALLSLAPGLVAILIYLVAHRTWVRNVYPQQPSYDFVPPLRAGVQALFIYNHSLLSFYRDPLLLMRAPAIQAAVQAVVVHVLVLPLVLAWLVARLKDRLLSFGTLWVLAAALPAVLLADFHSSRFYYLPAFGVAIVWARLLDLAWTAARDKRRWGVQALVAGWTAYVLAANTATVVQITRADLAQSDVAQSIYALLRAERASIGPRPLVVLRQAPGAYFFSGYGAREMAKFALDDPAAEALLEERGAFGAPAGMPIVRVDASMRPPRLERLTGPNR